MYQRAEPKLAGITDRDYRRSVIVIATLVLTVIVLKVLLLSRLPVNQDEFNVLSSVYAYERGELMQPFQHFHVHFFVWLRAVGENEVTQVVAARIVMYLFLLGTCFYLFRMGSHILNVRGALFSVLCYVSFLFTVVNGASFRNDTPATFFIMFALYHFIAREDSLFSSLLGGFAMAISLLFTIKAAIYLPVFAGWFLSRLIISNGPAKSWRHISYFLTALISGFFMLYKLHAATLPPSLVSSVGAGVGDTSFLHKAFSMFVRFEGVFPGLKWFLLTLRADYIIWSLLLGGLVVYLIDLVRRKYTRTEPKAYLFVFLIPLLSLLIYRNAYPYFYVFLIPATTLFCGHSLEYILSVFKKPRQVAVPILSGVLGLLVIFSSIPYFTYFLASTSKTTAVQRDICSKIHTMFPSSVAYIDGCSMVSSFRKVGFFMSSAGMENYLQRGEPVMQGVLNEETPLFLLANVPHLDLHSVEPPVSDTSLTLLEADWRALKSYFIHHWGPVWVVGKQFSLGPERRLEHFEIVVPGLYTVEAAAEIVVDGALHRQGDVVQLEEGTHTIEFKGGRDTMIRLKWGDHLYRPDSESESSFFLGPFI